MIDFIICTKCHARLIDEEFDEHVCTQTYRFEGDYLLVRRDGYWKKLHIPTLRLFDQPKLNTNIDQSSIKQNRKDNILNNFPQRKSQEIAKKEDYSNT